MKYKKQKQVIVLDKNNIPYVDGFFQFFIIKTYRKIMF